MEDQPQDPLEFPDLGSEANPAQAVDDNDDDNAEDEDQAFFMSLGNSMQFFPHFFAFFFFHLSFSYATDGDEGPDADSGEDVGDTADMDTGLGDVDNINVDNPSNHVGVL